MQNFLILSIFVLTATLTAQAQQIPCDRDAINGIYEGQTTFFDSYDSEVVQMSIRAEIGQVPLKMKNLNDLIRARISIACGTKVIPALYTVRCYEDGTNRLTLIDEGSSQCSLGSDPELVFYNGRLQIRTGFRAPGFRGTYDFRRTGDLNWLF